MPTKQELPPPSFEYDQDSTEVGVRDRKPRQGDIIKTTAGSGGQIRRYRTVQVNELPTSLADSLMYTIWAVSAGKAMRRFIIERYPDGSFGVAWPSNWWYEPWDGRDVYQEDVLPELTREKERKMTLVRKGNITKDTVAETFRGNYQKTRKWDSAWNATLDQLARQVRMESLRRTGSARPQEVEQRDIAKVLQEVVDQVLLEEGDPMTVFVNDTLRKLRENGALAALEEEDRRAQAGLTEEQRDEFEGPILFLEFDQNEPILEGWVVDYPDHYRGYGGPKVAVLAGSDKDTIGQDIAEIFEEYYA